MLFTPADRIHDKENLVPCPDQELQSRQKQIL
jgi:hypothetical protein